MMKLISICLFVLCATISAVEHPSGYIELIDLPITVRVDTNDTEVKAVHDLVRKFLSTRPDSLYDNPCWNESEKKKYPEPFPARKIIFQGPEIVSAFPPKILSIEKEGEYYCIRILFNREGLEAPYQNSNPWAILRLYAKKTGIKDKKDEKKIEGAESETDAEKKDNKEYRLFDPLRILTKDWRRQRVGPIEYVYPFNHFLEPRESRAMAQFCRGITQKYKVAEVALIEFYICRNVDELAQIVGLDYILGPTSGRSHGPNGQVFSALGNEWYPHEIVHVYFRDYRPHYILMEGIATYEGGSLKKSFDELVAELADYLNKNDTISFQNFLDSPYLEGGTTFFYTVGAVLCKMADRQGGPPAVKALLEAGTDNEQLYEKIESVLEIKREDMTGVLRAKVKEYSGK